MAERRRKQQKGVSVAKELLGCGCLVQPFFTAKRYEVPIHIDNKMLLDSSVTVSGTFSEEQSLKEILRVISRSLPIKWSQRNGAYYIQ